MSSLSSRCVSAFLIKQRVLSARGFPALLLLNFDMKNEGNRETFGNFPPKWQSVSRDSLIFPFIVVETSCQIRCNVPLNRSHFRLWTLKLMTSYVHKYNIGFNGLCY